MSVTILKVRLSVISTSAKLSTVHCQIYRYLTGQTCRGDGHRRRRVHKRLFCLSMEELIEIPMYNFDLLPVIG